MKKVLEIIIGILVVYLVVSYIVQFSYGQISADTKTVQEVVALANKTADGQLIAQEFFKKHPTPTNNNLNVLIKLVDEITIRDIARQQTGDMTIKTKTEMDIDKEKENDKQYVEFLKSYPIPFVKINFLQSIVVLLCLSMLALALNFFSRRNN